MSSPARGWRGVFAIPCAPFDADGMLDVADLERQLRFCLDAGAHGIAVPLLASEFYTLSDAERRRMLEVTVGVTAGAVPVLAGVSGTSTPHAVELARHAAEAGADGIVAMPPYIVRLAPDEIVASFAALAAVADLPIMAQNAAPPQPVGSPMETPLLERICRVVPAVRAVKEERTPGPHFLSQDIATLDGLIDGVFGGRAGLYLMDELERGAAGTMVAPELVDLLVAVFDHFSAGRRDDARALHERLLPAIAKEVLLGPPFAKRLLRLRGALRCVATRTGPDRWDAHEEEALRGLWARLEPLVTRPASAPA